MLSMPSRISATVLASLAGLMFTAAVADAAARAESVGLR
jgi:hypothetical protein